MNSRTSKTAKLATVAIFLSVFFALPVFFPISSVAQGCGSGASLLASLVGATKVSDIIAALQEKNDQVRKKVADVAQRSTVLIYYEDGSVASGVVIVKGSRPILLTAAHNVENQKISGIYMKVPGSSDSTALVGKIAATESHSKRSEAVANGAKAGVLGTDLALVMLDRPLPDWAVASPLEFGGMPELDSNKRVFFAGFGQTSVNLGSDLALRLLEFDSNRFEFLRASNQWPLFRFQTKDSSDRSGSCSGDSGGPIFVTKNGGSEVAVVGIHVRGMERIEGSGLCSGSSIHLQLGSNREEIAAMVASLNKKQVGDVAVSK